MEDKNLKENKEWDCEISYSHKAGSNGAMIKVSGKGEDIVNGLAHLIFQVVQTIANGDREAMFGIANIICEGAKKDMEEEGK